MFCQQKSCNSTCERGLWHCFFIPWNSGNWVAFGRKPLNGRFNGCVLLGTHAVAWLLWGGMCLHLVAPKVALPELEGCPQQDREGLQPCPPLFLPLPAVLSLCCSLVGSCCEDQTLLSPGLPCSSHVLNHWSHGSRFRRWHWEQTWCLQSISLWSGGPALVELP